MRKVVVIALTMLCLAGAFMSATVTADDLDVEVRSVARRLQCPICESVTVADSPAELAVQMRAIIRTKLEQGQSSDEIVGYFVERYGESVLVEPPRHGVGLMVWLGPLAALLLGGVALGLWMRPARGRRRATPQSASAAAAPAADWQLEAARRELDNLGRGRAG